MEDDDVVYGNKKDYGAITMRASKTGEWQLFKLNFAFVTCGTQTFDMSVSELRR